MPLVSLAILATVLIGFVYYRNSNAVNYGPFPYYGWGDGPFFGWFFFIPVIFIAFFAFRWFLWRPWGWGRGWYGGDYYYDDPAMETLRQRFARGEITKEKYEQMAKDLQE